MAFRISILLIIILVLTGCKDKGCPSPEPVLLYPISDTSNHWLQTIASKKIIYANSNKGRAESYTIQYSTKHQSYNEKFDDCTEIQRETRTVKYSSSLYNNRFILTTENIPNKEQYRINPDTYSYYQYNGNTHYCEMNIADLSNCTVSYIKNNSQKFETFPVSKIDSIQVKKTTYYNVYKIDFKDIAYSLDQTTKIIYFTPQYGLVQMETFDGEIWGFTN